MFFGEKLFRKHRTKNSNVRCLAHRAARFLLVQQTKTGENIPNNHKIPIPKCPQIIPNGLKIYQHLPLKNPPKLTQIRIFGFENMPSGKPTCSFCHRNILGRFAFDANSFSPFHSQKFAEFRILFLLHKISVEARDLSDPKKLLHKSCIHKLDSD
jgi:hypothetical protein